MAIFDYKDKNVPQTIRDALIVNELNFQTRVHADYHFSGEGGWRVLTGKDLNYQGAAGKYDEFRGESLPYSGAEASVLGQYDDRGRLTKIGIGFWATGTYKDAGADSQENTFWDVISNLSTAALADYADNYVRNAFNNLMGSVVNFAKAHGLSGEDVTVSGHSLGGMAVNSMATLSAKGAWDGFFNDASYIALASPTQNQQNSSVLNIGYENDPVFRVLDGHSLSWASLGNHDDPRATATNNIVNFEEHYAGRDGESPLMSIANPAAWSAHDGIDYSSGISRLLDSELYNFTHRDSTVVVSNLSPDDAQRVWVRDLNKSIPHSGTTYIVGTDGRDLLHGGSGNDYLSGGKGNDDFHDSGGYNIFYGGEGVNRYVTNASPAEMAFSLDKNGDLYARDNAGGITRASDIQRVKSSADGALDYAVTADGLKAGNSLIHYQDSYFAGADNNFTLSVTGNNSWLFAENGDSALTISGNNNSVISGSGNDRFDLAGNGNTLLFYGDFGHDAIYNISRSDSLVFMANANIADRDSVQNHVSYANNSAELTFGDSSVTLVGVTASTLSDMHIVIA